jgi:hypothetical protein
MQHHAGAADTKKGRRLRDAPMGFRSEDDQDFFFLA